MRATQTKIDGIHRWPLIGAAGLAVLALVVVAQARITDTGTVKRTIGEVAQSRDLLFRDGDLGRVVVQDAKTGETVGTFGRGEGAFIRQSMRAMAHNRRQHAVKRGLPYRLVRTAGGKLSIVDPATGKFIKLNAFGRVAIDGYMALLNGGTGAATFATAGSGA